MSNTFVTINVYTLTEHDHPISQSYHYYHYHQNFTLGFIFGVHSTVFDKLIQTCIQHYSIIQSSFIVLKILCATPIFPYLFPNHLDD